MSVYGSALEVDRIRYPDADSPFLNGSTRGEDLQSKGEIVDDCLFVAVGKEVRENRSTVIWALQNSGGKKIWILHVHTPSQVVPLLSKVGKQDAMAYHEKEKKEMLRILDEYVQLCAKTGVNAQKIYIEADTIENGIIALISQNMIGRLVMGAATDNRYKRGMAILKSKKAIYVDSHSPSFCQIVFVCRGYLIYTREAVKPTLPNHESGEMNLLRSQARAETELSENKPIIHQDRLKSRPASIGGSNNDTDGCLTPPSNGSPSESEGFARSRVANSTHPPKPSDMVRGLPLPQGPDIPQLRAADLVPDVPRVEEGYVGASSPPAAPEKNLGDDLYDRIDKLMAEVDYLRHEAYLESMKRQRVENEAAEATRKGKVSENLYYEEQKRRHEFEEKLAKEKKEHESLKSHHAKCSEELRSVLLQKSSLEKEIENSNHLVEELDEKIFSALDLLEKYKKERDDVKIELDKALLENEVLRKQPQRADPRATQVSSFLAGFTYSEILEATDSFNTSSKIGEGGFGNTYKGLLRHTEVAIKVLSSDSLQGPQEFKQEVETLSKLRHPNIVMLIGVCSEASALIYEYYPNGSLDYRLACKDNTPPLSWQTRISIAAELCSVLMFLHSCQPESIIHGDLKPGNVLLDARLSCKLSDFGICRAVYNGERATGFYKTNPKGTFAYIDPEFVSTGELTPSSDIYSYGIILLSLLTGKSTLGIIHEVQKALDKNNLISVLDRSAGDWPIAQTNQLALLALRCCEMQRHKRPDLEADVWRLLDPMRISSANSP